MARKTERKALGRGLSALLGDQPQAGEPVAKPADGTRGVAIDLIDSNPGQPRKTFRDAELDELATSLRRHGLIQPIVLRPSPTTQGRFQIVAGERRWRAAQRAGLHDIPAVVREMDDRQVLELAIIENVQRVDLDPIEEGQGYRDLIEQFGYTQAELAEVVGKSRSHLANSMRLLSLPDPVIQMVRTGKLSAGHARALIGAQNPLELAQRVVGQNLSVRQTEELARKASGPEPTRARSQPEKDADTRLLESDISATIGLPVSIDHAKSGGGELRIKYKDLEQLDTLLARLSD